MHTNLMASSHFSSFTRRRGFTLIELLVVIAIIAILSVVVILTLNPAELLRQSRDANRVSDMATINGAFGIYAEDVGGSMGTPSTTYLSILDPTVTSTAGDQCQGLGLPAQSTSSGWIYQCGASSSYRNVIGTGWIPLNFGQMSTGVPFGALPQDPINQTSSNLYYTYTTDGNSYWQLTAHMESQKDIPLEASSGGADPAMYTAGNNTSLAPFVGGMVEWWTLNEGTGSTAYESSGYGNNGTWAGTPAGNGGTYYASGNNQASAGYFNGTN